MGGYKGLRSQQVDHVRTKGTEIEECMFKAKAREEQSPKAIAVAQ